MRTIESKMCDAIYRARNWRLDNTQVISRTEGIDVYLHGNHIAHVPHGDAPIQHRVVVNLITLRNWPTNTTLSRLRAMGCNIMTRKRVVFFNGVEVAQR
jgi:hypothetical protein